MNKLFLLGLSSLLVSPLSHAMKKSNGFSNIFEPLQEDLNPQGDQDQNTQAQQNPNNQLQNPPDIQVQIAAVNPNNLNHLLQQFDASGSEGDVHSYHGPIPSGHEFSSGSLQQSEDPHGDHLSGFHGEPEENNEEEKDDNEEHQNDNDTFLNLDHQMYRSKSAPEILSSQLPQED